MNEISEPKIDLPQTHPYLATLYIDPAELHDLERRFTDRREVKILGVDTTMPDNWVVYVACASEQIVRKLEENW